MRLSSIIALCRASVPAIVVAFAFGDKATVFMTTVVECRAMRNVFNPGRWVCVLLLAALVLSAGIPVAHAQNERLVLAFYYAWFDRNAWSSGQFSDLPAQLYDSRDRATIQRHVAQAQSAGIDAFVQSWYGPSGGVNNMTESNFAVLLDVAAQSGFRAAVDFEVTGPFFGSIDDVQSALSILLSGHAQHPAYLRVGGKPVVFFWRQQRFSVDDWAAIRKRVDPNHASLWIAEGTDPSYLRAFDGIYWYNVAWSADPATALTNYAARVRQTAQDLGGFRYWVSPVMPGYDDTRLRGSAGFVRPRANGDYYRATFAGASKSGADWVVVTSFNEWPEGSQIEPSVAYGDTYLNLTRELAAVFRTGIVVAPSVASAPSPVAVTVVTPAANPQDLRAMSAAAPSPTPTPTVTTTPSPSPTDAATSTSTPTPTATASATPWPTSVPTETPFPTPTSMPSFVSGLGQVPFGLWMIVGTAALVLGAVLGGVSVRRRTGH
jgi:hypothetical protein